MSVKRMSRNPMGYAHSVKSVPKIIGLSKAYFEKESMMNTDKIIAEIDKIITQLDETNAALKRLIGE